MYSAKKWEFKISKDSEDWAIGILKPENFICLLDILDRMDLSMLNICKVVFLLSWDPEGIFTPMVVPEWYLS